MTLKTLEKTINMFTYTNSIIDGLLDHMLWPKITENVGLIQVSMMADQLRLVSKLKKGPLYVKMLENYFKAS